jgi:hypothetical protein
VPGLDFAYDSVTASSQWATPAVDYGFLTAPQGTVNSQGFHYGEREDLEWEVCEPLATP